MLKTKENIFIKMTYFSIWSLVLFSFVSLSATALSHILILIPGVYFLKEYMKNKDSKLSKSSIALLSVIFFSIISVIFADDIDNKWKQISKLKYMLFGILAIIPYREVFKTLKRVQVRLMMNWFMCLVAIGNIAGIYALYTQYHPLRMKAASDAGRAAGMYGMAITYGYGIELVLILLIALLVLFRKRIDGIVNSKLFYLCLITTLAGFYLSFARGALLGFLFSLPFIFVKIYPKLFKIFLVSALGVVVLITALAVFKGSDSKSGNRFVLKLQSESNLIRLSQYKAAYKGFLEKPFTGWGFRNFERNCYDIKVRNNIGQQYFQGHAHSNYFEALASTGIFGFTSFVLFVFFWFWEIWKREDDLGLLLLPFVVSFAISGAFQNTFTDGENMFVIMFIYSISQALNKKKIKI